MKRYFVVRIGNTVGDERIIQENDTLIRTIDKEKAENYFDWRVKECPEEHLELRFMSIGEGDDCVKVLKSLKDGTLEENNKKMTIPKAVAQLELLKGPLDAPHNPVDALGSDSLETPVEASSSPVEPL